MTILIGLAAAVLVLLVVGLVSFNRLGRLCAEAEQSWANISVELSRRVELLDNMMVVARTYAEHEEETLRGVTEARRAVVAAATPGQAALASAQSTRAVLGLVEAYPELKADRQFQALNREMSVSADRISAARRYYNHVVGQYNGAIQTLPAAIVARLTGASELEYCNDEELDPRGPILTVPSRPCRTSAP
jgi:LemA protein